MTPWSVAIMTFVWPWWLALIIFNAYEWHAVPLGAPTITYGLVATFTISVGFLRLTIPEKEPNYEITANVMWGSYVLTSIFTFILYSLS